MLDPKEVAKFDQASQQLAETVPPMLKSLYEGLLKEGFTEQQAWELVKVSMFAFWGGKGVSG